jgi:drug/metabolite transporter (DMT)-like permease
MSAVLLGNVLASIAAMPFALPFPAASTGEWITVVYLGVCQIGLAYVFLTAGIRHLQALEASLLLLVEPALNPVWTWIVRGESPGAWTIVGGAIILTATALRSLHESRISPMLVVE